MTKQEFIDKLRISLNGKVSPEVVQDTLIYYEDYISTQMRLGKTEDEVMNLLGDPRLIAKTTVETNGGGSRSEIPYQSQTEYSEDSREEMPHHMGMRMNLPGWAWILIMVVVLVVIFRIVVRICAFLMPVLMPLLLCILIYKIFRDWLR